MSDTFDPAVMAGPALSFLLANLDCPIGCVPRFTTELDGSIVSRHAGWDFGDLMGRYLDAMILLRTVNGSRLHLAKEQRLRSRFLGTFENGLTYRDETPFSDREADIFDQSSSLMALATWYEHTGDARVRHMIENMVSSLTKLAVHEGASCRFAYPTYLPGGTEGPHRDNWNHADPAHHGGRLLVGLAPLLDDGIEGVDRLAACIARYAAYDSGLFDLESDVVFTDHMHSRTATLAGLIRYARHTGDAGLMDRCRQIYAYAKSAGTGFGWFPEVVDPDHPDNPRTQQSEGEIAADMIEVALLLAEDDPAYYEDVERFARNHFFESQLKTLPPSLAGAPNAEEAIGAFAGFSKPNDWGTHTMNCCAGGAARGIYLLWRHAIELCDDGEAVCVNLLFDGEGHGVRVDSHLPYEGAVDLTALEDVVVRVRIPSWVLAGETKCDCPTAVAGARWTQVVLKRGETTRVAFPLPRFAETVTTPAGRYVVQWTGYTVTRIDPPGTFIPLYRDRDPDRAMPMVEKKYFHPNREIGW